MKFDNFQPDRLDIMQVSVKASVHIIHIDMNKLTEDFC